MFWIKFDASDIIGLEKNLIPAVEAAAKKAAGDLARMTKVHLVEEAGHKLKTRRKQFVDSLSTLQVDDDTYLVILDKKAVWIDEGVRPGSMIESLLKSKHVKTAKDGSRYAIVPFNHSPGQGKTQTTPAQLDLISTVRSEFKKNNIPFGGIEKNADGSARQGLLHKLDINHAPTKTGEGPGMGHGAVGGVRQGLGGTPFLKGVRVYQSEHKDPVTGKNTTKRSILTFRTVSDKQIGSGKWEHPGLEGTHLMDEAFSWAQDQFEKLIGPQLLKDFEKGL